MKRVSAIVPCYNEENNICLFYEAIISAFKNTEYELEIIFINDGSSDNTEKEIKKIMDRKSCSIRYIAFSRNFGKEAAMYAGFKHATGEYTVTIDVDMQQKPALILDMLKIVEEEPEYDGVVYYQERRKESWIFKVFKKVFYAVMNKISEVEFVPGASDFRLFSKDMVKAILELGEVNRFSKGIFSWIGFNKKYIPYTPDARADGKTKWNFFKLLKYAVDGVLSFSEAPIRISSTLGGLMSVVSFIYLLVVIFEKLIKGIGIPGYPTIVAAILFIGGIQLLCIGINGQYMAKIFMETKERPIYIAKNSLSNIEGEE